MQKNLKLVIDAVSQDKNLDRAVIIDALEQAMVHAARKTMGATLDLEASYKEEEDEIELFQFRTVVEEVENPDTEIIVADALKHDPEAVLGDALGFKLETNKFGRISAQCAKQIIVQKVRDAERAQIFEEFKDRVGEILSGYVRRIERGDLIVDLGRTEAVIPYREQVPGERYKPKDRIQGYVTEIKRSSRGPQVVLSRGHPGFLISLFEQHVTEIYDGIVTIESAARDPGSRSKIAVHSRDSSVDPVGACVGVKGQRVQAIIQELNNEKVDIIPFDEDPARLVCNALRPAVVSKVIVDEDNNSMDVIVSDDQLSLAIGKRGQNVRLAAQLTGWRLDIKSESKLNQVSSDIKEKIAKVPGIGTMRADILVNEGIKSLEELSQASPRMLVRKLNLEDEEAENVVAAAKELFEEEQMLANATAEPEMKKVRTADEKSAANTDALFGFFKVKLNGISDVHARAIADAGYKTVGDILADSADEVAEKTELDLEQAKAIQQIANSHF